ncbi:RING-H2 finger protein ATL46-like isoform X1 [Sesamum indicum]|uniref:RING-type E3 ubiquitin transferase n=1 Tax=Sesamum indicum TaxID=4182 RepID=A0A6I9SPH7_SESIN|nr:RING-H2 finger protein ATL46-like isoform X1 [Sesamum indicum]
MSWIQSAFGSKISPVILFIIVVLAVVFFIAAILHLLIRFLLKQRSAQSHNYPEMSTSGAFQRQLQQLFHLHDSGLDQAYIDALPVFLYKDIMGLKEPFDCAVCLCEFSEQDKLRLLPLCSHAFHIDCIDTWLLSNSTCPLCRGVILSPGFSFENPVFYFEDSKETEDGSSGNAGFVGVPRALKPSEDDNGSIINEKRVFSVRLGKFRSTNNGANQESEVGETSNSNLDARRCYSMGSFQYVVADSDLQVALCPSSRDKEHGGEGSDVKGRGGQIGNFTIDGVAADADAKKINNGVKGESFSVSKIWLWSKKDFLHYSFQLWGWKMRKG